LRHYLDQVTDGLSTISRRRAVLGRSVLGLSAALLMSIVPGMAQAQAPTAPPVIDLAKATAPRVLGKPDAPILLEEFASLTCPHCADFHRDILPKLKAEFIDTGQVRLVFHDFPWDRVALTGAMLARCLPPDRYFSFMSVLFKSQRQWLANPDPVAGLAQNARLAGMTPALYDACLASQPLKESIAKSVMTGKEKYSINSTPTFIINGKDRVEGAKEQEIIDALVKAGAKRVAAAPAAP
jgi:protein-disulfide isomerase